MSLFIRILLVAFALSFAVPVAAQSSSERSATALESIAYELRSQRSSEDLQRSYDRWMAANDKLFAAPECACGYYVETLAAYIARTNEENRVLAEQQKPQREKEMREWREKAAKDKVDLDVYLKDLIANLPKK